MLFTEENLTKYWSEKTLHLCEVGFIPINKNYCKERMTHNASALDNHLILRKNPIKIKNYDFLCVAEN